MKSRYEVVNLIERILDSFYYDNEFPNYTIIRNKLLERRGISDVIIENDNEIISINEMTSLERINENNNIQIPLYKTTNLLQNEEKTINYMFLNDGVKIPEVNHFNQTIKNTHYLFITIESTVDDYQHLNYNNILKLICYYVRREKLDKILENNKITEEFIINLSEESKFNFNLENDDIQLYIKGSLKGCLIKKDLLEQISESISVVNNDNFDTLQIGRVMEYIG